MKVNKSNENDIKDFYNQNEKLEGKKFNIVLNPFSQTDNRITRRVKPESEEDQEESSSFRNKQGEEEKQIEPEEIKIKILPKKENNEKAEKQKGDNTKGLEKKGVLEKIKQEKEIKRKIEEEKKRREFQKNPLKEEELQRIVKKNIQIKGFEFSDDKGEIKKEKFKKEKERAKAKEELKRQKEEEIREKKKEEDRKNRIAKNSDVVDTRKIVEEDPDLMDLEKEKDLAEKKIFNYEIKFKNPEAKDKKTIPKVSHLFGSTIVRKGEDPGKYIKETIREVREKNKDSSESSIEEEEKDESFESFTERSGVDEKQIERLVNIAKDIRTKFINPRLGKLKPRRKLLLDPEIEGKPFKQIMKDMSEEDIVLFRDYIPIPASQSVVDGVTYEFLGGFLGELGDTSDDCLHFLSGLKKTGFKIPDELYNYISYFLPIPFSSMIKLRPGLFASYGPTFGELSAFRRPDPLKNKGALDKRKVSYQEISSLLGNLPREIKQDKYVSELLALLYLGDTFGDEIPESPNTTLVFESFRKGVEKCQEIQSKIIKDVSEMLKEPEAYIQRKIPNALYYSPNEKITLIDENQRISDIRACDVAKIIKTSFKVNSPDLITVTILAQFVPQKIPDLAYSVLENYYVGTGSIADISERYNKSLQIYNESNSLDNQKFHKKYYHDEFSNAMKELGYYLEPKYKTKIPTDINEFLSINDISGARLIGVNNHAMGTFTSNLKRRDTSLLEIKAGLENFKILKEDPSNPGYQFFFYGFKKVAAKFKDEIHSFDKPPRFYNPTFIAAFIPFQFLFNYCFQFFEPFSAKCPSSLLGIKDVGKNFFNVMTKIYKSGNLRLHYSDNFWIKEGSKFVSVDVKRCDSNLSKEALYYPIKYLSKLVLDEEDNKKMLILAKLFKGVIPREAFFGISQGKESFLYSFPFFWLPSGVVGTAYLNHMFTGFFLYYTRKTRWISENGGLTEELLKQAKRFGIHLEVASYVDFSKIKEGEIVNFDLLARSGIFYKNVFIPILDHKRVWMSLLFMKKGKYDKNSLIANYVRLCKVDSMLSLGAGLDPVLGQFIYSLLIYLLSSIRHSFITLTPEQSKILVDALEEYSITPIGFTSQIFASHIPNASAYIKDKTGLDLDYPPAKQFDFNIKEKIDLYASVWATLGEVLNGVEGKSKTYTHRQYGVTPYFVAPYFFRFLGTLNFESSNLNMLSKYLLLLFGDKIGLMLFKDFISIIIREYKTPFFKGLRSSVKKILTQSIDIIKKNSNQSVQDIKKTINEALTQFMADPDLSHIEFSLPIEKGKSVSISSKYKLIKMGFNILNKVNLTDVFGSFGEIWTPIMHTRFTRYLNFCESYLLFEGEYWYDAAREGKLRREAPPIKEFRRLPIIFLGKKIFDPTALKAENMNLEVEGRTPLADDLGMLTGIITEYLIRYPDGFSNITNEKIFEKDKNKGINETK